MSKSLTGACQQKNDVRKGTESVWHFQSVCSAVIGVLKRRGGSWNQPNRAKQLRTEVQKNANRVVVIIRSQVSTCAASGAVSQTFRGTLTRMLAASQIKWKWQILNPVPVRCFNPAPGSTPATSAAREREVQELHHDCVWSHCKHLINLLRSNYKQLKSYYDGTEGQHKLIWVSLQ